MSQSVKEQGVLLMMKINWLRIVPLLLLLFTFFINPCFASRIEKIKSESVSGGYFIGRIDEPGQLKFRDKVIPVDEFGFFQIGFSREMAGLHEIEIIDANDQMTFYPIWVELREFKEQRVNGVDQAKVTPPKSLQARIEKEYFQVLKARSSSSTLAAWRDELFVWPIFGRITGVYGSQRFYNGTAGNPHWGVDMAAAKGTRIFAPASGQVVLAEADLYFSGGTVILDHGNGLTSSFLHLSKLNVEAGQFLDQGDVLGFVGSTGRSTGPHLDWRMNLHDERIDAQLWVPDMNSLCIDNPNSCPVPEKLDAGDQRLWQKNRETLQQRLNRKN
jgi:hypothetical protein